VSYKFGFSWALRWAAIVCWVLIGASAGGCAFPDHSFSDENCTNGIDDDGNGHIDCDDPGCKSVVKCVEPVPTGWLGPVAIWQGAGGDTPPDCNDSQFPATSFSQLFKDPNNVGVGLETCPKCSCNGSPDIGHAKCVARLQGSSLSQCGGNRQLLVDTEDNQQGYPVGSDCTTVTFDTAQFTPLAMIFTDPYPVVTGCTSVSTGSASFPKATFSSTLRACNLSDVNPGGCSSGQKCVPRPKQGLKSLVCVYQENTAGTSSCLNPFKDEMFVYNEYVDGRTCGGCSCKPNNVTCSAPTSGTYYDDSFCTTTPQNIPLAPSCTSTQGRTTLYATITSTPSASGSSTCEPTGGTVQGGVTPLHSYTFCCISAR